MNCEVMEILLRKLTEYKERNTVIEKKEGNITKEKIIIKDFIRIVS